MEFDTKTRKAFEDLPQLCMLMDPSAQYLNEDTKSFAYKSARDRWPIIIVSI